METDKLEAIRNAGVIGAGGAGFPTHVKLDAEVEYVIANGAECEPLLRGDRHLMKEEPEGILDGMETAMALTGAEKGYIALKGKYESAISALEKVLRARKEEPGGGGDDKPPIEIFPLDNFYPAGDEQVLVYEVTGRIVPEGGLPLDVGVVVDNVGTLYQISRAVRGESVTGRWVTVTGAVREPHTLWTPVGTPVSSALELAGGTTVSEYSVICGGPMMGKPLSSDSAPVTKTTSGLIVLPKDHYVIKTVDRTGTANVRYTVAACIQCQQCTDVCPRRNLGKYVCPDKVMKGIAYGIASRPEHMTTAYLCVECGLCTYYGCPMGLDPYRMMVRTKEVLAKSGVENPHREEIGKAHEYRELRKVPLKRLMAGLDLLRYDSDAPRSNEEVRPSRVEIPLNQHIGAPSVPVVEKGDRVEKGQLIADIPKGALGARYHASIDGAVVRADGPIVIERS